MLSEIRGYGAIQNLFRGSFGEVDIKKADEFQDMIGRFVAEAINEKLSKQESK